MSIENIIKQVADEKHDKIKFAICDIDGILRGKYIHKSKFLDNINRNQSNELEGLGFCDVIFGWDSADRCYDNIEFTGWHSGYPDRSAYIDLSTYRKTPWEQDQIFFLADYAKIRDEQVVCPRTILKKQVQKAQELGYTPRFSQEFEWFNFKENANKWEGDPKESPALIAKAMFGYSILSGSFYSDYFHQLFDQLGKFKVPLESLHTETGLGVLEACIQYTDILEAADRATLFKTAVKEIAHQNQIIASFMAKWNMDFPGCSGHVHQSLWKGSKNIFYDADSKDNMSKIMKSFLAGQLYCLPYLLPFYAPTVNSYKRLVKGAWAPTTLTWGIDNRTTALRVVTGDARKMRLEMRVPGADANPYLVMAACLASGLYGIENKMSLDVPPTQGSGYQNKNNGTLASNLWEATQAMKNSELPQELFGEFFINHFAATREWEWKNFGEQITDWEIKRYFEII